MPYGSIPPARLESSRRVRAARGWAGLPQWKLAQRIGLNLATLRRIEAGHEPVDADLVGRIAAATRVPVGFLLRGFEPYEERPS